MKIAVFGNTADNMVGYLNDTKDRGYRLNSKLFFGFPGWGDDFDFLLGEFQPDLILVKVGNGSSRNRDLFAGLEYVAHMHELMPNTPIIVSMDCLKEENSELRMAALEAGAAVAYSWLLDINWPEIRTILGTYREVAEERSRG